jgi:hypothetical protein
MALALVAAFGFYQLARRRLFESPLPSTQPAGD